MRRSAFPSPCRHPGCGKAGYEPCCQAHTRTRQRQPGQPRPSRRKALHKGGAGYGAGHDRWRKFTLAADSVCHWPTENGLCLNPATVADHVIPLRIAPELRYEQSNAQGLCTRCHNRKTAEEKRGRYWNTRTNQVETYQRPKNSPLPTRLHRE